nr:winged helix-turn-helix transcriptional regulator [Nevskia ramosa]
MNRITAVETSRAEERARQAQRSTEAAAYAARKVSRSKATEAAAKAAKAAREATGNQRVQAFKVSDEALIAELRAGRYESVSALAHKIGLAVPTVHTRVNRLVSTGAISREDVPQYRKGGR